MRHGDGALPALLPWYALLLPLSTVRTPVERMYPGVVETKIPSSAIDSKPN